MIARFVSFLLLVLTLSVTPAFAADDGSLPSAVDLSQEPTASDVPIGNTADSQRYALRVTASNARLQLRVNDVPVGFKIFRNSETVDITFNEWLKRGLNVVEVQMERFSEQQQYTANYSVYFQSPTQIVSGERRMLYESPEQSTLPLRQLVGLRVQSIPELRIWEAEKVDMVPEEKKRLVDAINGLRSRLVDALAHGDNAFLATYDKSIRDEIDKAYGRIPQGEQDTMKRRTEIARQLRGMVNANVVLSPELKVDDLNFELIGEGHLVRVTRLDSNPVIKVSRGNLTFTISKPVYGTVGGLWDMLAN